MPRWIGPDRDPRQRRRTPVKVSNDGATSMSLREQNGREAVSEGPAIAGATLESLLLLPKLEARAAILFPVVLPHPRLSAASAANGT
jgi:hypothetical protein